MKKNNIKNLKIQVENTYIGLNYIYKYKGHLMHRTHSSEPFIITKNNNIYLFNYQNKKGYSKISIKKICSLIDSNKLLNDFYYKNN